MTPRRQQTLFISGLYDWIVDNGYALFISQWRMAALALEGFAQRKMVFVFL